LMSSVYPLFVMSEPGMLVILVPGVVERQITCVFGLVRIMVTEEEWPQ
jgi:hypothetical protein